MSTAKKMIAVLIGTFIVYLGFSLAIKADVGLGAWDAMLTTFSAVSGVQVGTISILFSTSCVLGQLGVERRNFKPIQLLQLLSVFCGGTLLNLLVYGLFRNLHFATYLLQLIVAVFSYLLIALGVLMIMESRLIRNPVEGLCQVITERCGGQLGRFRQMIDWGFMAVALALSFSFKTKINIREGTVICMLIFGPALDFLRIPVRNAMKRLSF